jgi:hypothetical protein
MIVADARTLVEKPAAATTGDRVVAGTAKARSGVAQTGSATSSPQRAQGASTIGNATVN